LKILKDAGLVSARPAGRMTYYTLQRNAADALPAFLGRLERAASRSRS
jgi:DNA-binding transcriptional ArsR family regulator